MSRRYTIYRLSAKAMLGYAKETENNIYTFDLNADATARCKVPTATHEQEDTALFFQMLCVLHGDDYVQTDSNEHSRNPQNKRHQLCHQSVGLADGFLLLPGRALFG